MGDEMKTIADEVLEHAKNYKAHGTSEGLTLLSLPHNPEHYGAANLYSAALSIINKQQREIEELKKQLAYWENK
jgi:hypothetical protein